MEGEPQRRTRPSIVVGQLLASGFTAFFLTFLIGEGVSDGVDHVTWEGIGLVAVMVFASVSVLVAWVDPSLGSRLLLASGVALAAFVAISAETNQLGAASLLSAPYLFSALAIWFGARRLARPGGPVPGA